MYACACAYVYGLRLLCVYLYNLLCGITLRQVPYASRVPAAGDDALQGGGVQATTSLLALLVLALLVLAILVPKEGLHLAASAIGLFSCCAWVMLRDRLGDHERDTAEANRPRVTREESRAYTDMPPEDWPAVVTLLGSPST